MQRIGNVKKNVKKNAAKSLMGSVILINTYHNLDNPTHPRLPSAVEKAANIISFFYKQTFGCLKISVLKIIQSYIQCSLFLRLQEKHFTRISSFLQLQERRFMCISSFLRLQERHFMRISSFLQLQERHFTRISSFLRLQERHFMRISSFLRLQEGISCNSGILNNHRNIKTLSA